MGLIAGMKRAVARTELMQAMFQKLGVSGWFAQDPARAAVLRSAAVRCASCGHESECRDWLDHNASADRAPGFCRNADLINRIGSPKALRAPD